MTQIVDERLKKMCNKCESNLDKPCAWLSLGNEYCEEIMNIEQELQRKDNIINELENTLETCIYGIEPKGCSINYNCEYDSEEDYICAMQEQSRLNTYKFVLDKIKELESK